MNILSVFLFAISSSSDNLIVGLSYGAKKVRINFMNNFIISFISGIGTFLAMLFGRVLLQLIPLKCSNIIGSGILILFGIYLLINWLRKGIGIKKNTEKINDDISEFQRYENTLRNPEIIDTNNSKTIDFKEAIILGFVLCLNNIGLGIGASITGLNIFMTSISSLVFSLVFIPIGYYIGENVLSDKLSRYSEIISICIIIILGVYELFI
ncbi:sporulation membrane protein YtaF [Clostridium tagluense]|uniref:sporulation membrane protein YtaF n=1 Tax=Clostridium tagluense TaxID=360422 RepID=UPI001C6E44C9|nr:sporulation membrane protein YtaF [Clostridium tagluense]MBW9157380.1 sporulation membrane protein YtaF [Clostridium tagluense]WLC66752.1 sporulation membrane protein YtaF [Clostridium tagluense]